MPNRRMMERMVNSFTQSFEESLRQSQTDKRKKDFRDSVRREYMILTNPDVGEMSKKVAYGQLQSMGVTPPARMLQKKVDWTPVLKEMSIPESTWAAFRDVDPPDALRLISYLIPDDADTNPLFRFAVSQGWMTQEQADKTISVGAVEKIAGQKVANQYATQIGILSSAEAESDTRWDSITTKVDAGATKRSDFSADEWVAIDDAMPSSERKNAFFGKKGDIGKLFALGRKSIQSKGSQLFFGGFTFSDDLLAWKQGTLDKKAEVEYLDKYFDKTTGEIRPEAIIAEAEIVQTAIGNLEEKVNEDVKSMLWELVYLNPEEIDWNKVQADLRTHNVDVTIEEIQKYYNDIKTKVR